MNIPNGWLFLICSYAPLLIPKERESGFPFARRSIEIYTSLTNAITVMGGPPRPGSAVIGMNETRGLL